MRIRKGYSADCDGVRRVLDKAISDAKLPTIDMINVSSNLRENKYDTQSDRAFCEPS